MAYLGLRVWFALTLLTHGYPKLLHLPHSGAPDFYAALVQIICGKMHLPLAGVLAMLVTVIKTAGAALLGVGLATRLAAAAIIVDLLIAAFGVHSKVGLGAGRYGISAADGGAGRLYLHPGWRSAFAGPPPFGPARAIAVEGSC